MSMVSVRYIVDDVEASARRAVLAVPGSAAVGPAAARGGQRVRDARLRGDQTDSMRGSLCAGPHSWDAVYLLNGELYQSKWFAAEALARADLAAHQDALAAAGWIPVPFHP